MVMTVTAPCCAVRTIRLPLAMRASAALTSAPRLTTSAAAPSTMGLTVMRTVDGLTVATAICAGVPAITIGVDCARMIAGATAKPALAAAIDFKALRLDSDMRGHHHMNLLGGTTDSESGKLGA